MTSPLIKYRVFILTVSDSRTPENDVGGQSVEDFMTARGFEIVGRKIVRDDLDEISAVLRTLAETDAAELVLTTGGTGFGPRDNTPEATTAVITRPAPGFSETMRLVTAAQNPKAILSRGTSGVCRTTLFINLPGSPAGAVECLTAIIDVVPHALRMMSGDTRH